MLSGEAAKINLILFGVTQQESKPRFF